MVVRRSWEDVKMGLEEVASGILGKLGLRRGMRGGAIGLVFVRRRRIRSRDFVRVSFCFHGAYMYQLAFTQRRCLRASGAGRSRLLVPGSGEPRIQDPNFSFHAGYPIFKVGRDETG